MAETLSDFWDRYARNWKATPEAPLLGKEWHNEQGFVAKLAETIAGLDRFTALEVGCGGGRMSLEFLRLAGDRYAELVLSDPAPTMLEHCRANIGKRARLLFQRTNALDLDAFPDDHFDLVFSHDVFVHFEDVDVFNQMSHIFRVLRPGGWLLMSVNDPVLHFTYFKLWAANLRGTAPGARDVCRVHFITEPQMRTFAADLGYDEVEMKDSSFSVYRMRKPVPPTPGD